MTKDPYAPFLNWIEKERESTLETLKKWSRIHSGSYHLEGLDLMLKELKVAFSSLEALQQEVSLPKKKQIQQDGRFTEIPLGKALLIEKKRSAPLKILLSGHMDIAHSADHPLEPPILTDRDVLTGRGTADMKAGILVMLLALQALEKSPYATAISWKVVITPDEEIGSIGSRELLVGLAKQFDMGFVFEPTLPDGSIIDSRKGSINYLLSVKGRSVHAGRDFSMGRNALTEASRCALAMENLTDLQKGLTVNIGYLSGGGPLNVVPDAALCGINIRAETSQEFDEIKKKIEELLAQENKKEGYFLTIHQETERAPKIFDNKTKKLFEAFKKCAEEMGVPIEWKHSGGVCDGNTLAGAGLPTIDTLGAVGGFLHSHKEYVNISSILIRAKLVARFMMQLAEQRIGH